MLVLIYPQLILPSILLYVEGLYNIHKQAGLRVNAYSV